MYCVELALTVTLAPTNTSKKPSYPHIGADGHGIKESRIILLLFAQQEKVARKFELLTDTDAAVRVYEKTTRITAALPVLLYGHMGT